MLQSSKAPLVSQKDFFKNEKIIFRYGKVRKLVPSIPFIMFHCVNCSIEKRQAQSHLRLINSLLYDSTRFQIIVR